MSADDFLRGLFGGQKSTKEDLKREFTHAPPPTALPTQWRDGAGKIHLPGPQAPIVRDLTPQELANYSKTDINVCGTCKYFDLESGRKEMERQGFAAALIKEFGWKLKHLGAPIDTIGLCGASGGKTATTFISAACDQYRHTRV
jgi:hypothetical protein